MRRVSFSHRVFFVLSWALALILLVECRFTAWAQEVDYYLGEVVVTAERLPDPPYATDEISGGLLRKSPEVRSVARILRSMPSLHVTTGVKNEAKLYLRGFPQREVVVLLDGRPVYEPYFGTMDLDQLLLDGVAKIKVAKGPASALYGANALGGVVNIVTADAVSRGTLRGAVQFGNQGFRSARARYGGRRGPLFYWIAASGSETDGFRLPASFSATATEDGGVRENSDWQRLHGYAKLGWLLPRGGRVTLSAGLYDASKGVPPATRGLRPRYWRFSDWKRRFVDVNARVPLRRGFELRLRAFREHFDNTLESFSDAAYERRQWASTYRNRVSGAQLYASWLDGAHLRVDVGMQAKWDAVNTQGDVGEPWERFRAHTISVFGQAAWNPTVRWQGLLGVSLDELREQDGRTLHSVNPQLGLVYRLGNHVSVRWLTGRKSRFPTLKEWYGSLYGNRSLRPEMAWLHEAGFRITLGDVFRADLGAFRSDVKDLIVQRSRRAPYENLERVRLEGVELSGQWRPTEGLALRLGYTYLDARQVTDGSFLPYRPRNKWVGQVGFSLPGRVLVDVNAQLVSRRYYTTRSGGGWLDPYAVVDLRITWDGLAGLTPFLAIQNVLDACYEDELGFPMPGREWRVGASWQVGG